MTVATDGQIAFGYVLKNGQEFPWGDECQIEWWAIQKCVNPKETNLAVFARENPLPIDIVNYCSRQHPMLIAAVPGTCNSARRGYPQAFDPKELSVGIGSLHRFIEFLEKYKIEYSGEPQWYLTSYWG